MVHGSVSSEHSNGLKHSTFEHTTSTFILSRRTPLKPVVVSITRVELELETQRLSRECSRDRLPTLAQSPEWYR